MGQVKTCRKCGKEKGIEEFSKSYKDTCKDCVAEMMRDSRAKKAIQPKPIDWEQRRWEATLQIYCKRFEFEPHNQANFIEAVNDANRLVQTLQKADQP